MADAGEPAYFRGPELALDMAALGHNWQRFSIVGPCSVAAVVKADAYGLGMEVLAQALAQAQCRVFYVACAREGATLRTILGREAEILVLNGPDRADVPVFIEQALTPVLNSLPQIALWRETGEHRAALHMDTGMNRLGIAPSDWTKAQALWPDPCVLISHLACADTPAHTLNQTQCEQFSSLATRFPDARKSLAASAGAALGAQYWFDEIRIGLGLYGGGPDFAGRPPAQLAKLSAPVLQTRRLEPGASVGYGASYSLALEAEPSKLACIGIGYADGAFLIGSAGKGYMFACGQKCRIIGRVSMDLTMLDISGLTLEPGDRVEVFGPNLGLNDQAGAFGTIPYVLLTSLGTRIRRV